MTEKFGKGGQFGMTTIREKGINVYYHGWDLRSNNTYRGFIFIKYPRWQSYPHPRWDTHLEPQDFCKNHEYIRHSGGRPVYRCKGHCHDITKRKNYLNYLNSTRVNLDNAAATVTRAAGTATSQNSAARTKLQAEHDKKISDMTAEYDSEVRAITEKQNELDESKVALQAEYNKLEQEYKLKRMEVTQLNSDIRIAKYQAAEAQAALKQELALLQSDYLNRKDILDKKKEDIEAEQVKIDNKKLEIKELEIKIGNRWEEYNQRTEDLEKLEDEIEELENSKPIRLANLQNAKSVEDRLNATLAELEKELLELKKDPEKKYNPLILKRLMRRKKKVLKQLFRVEEDAYNTHSRIVNVRSERNHTTDMLLDNQNREIDKNTKNIGNAKDELGNTNRRIHIEQNNTRKRDYYIYLLKHTFIFILACMLVIMSTRMKLIPKSMGITIIVILMIILGIIILANVYYNRRRNRLFFNKIDFPVAKEIVSAKECPKKT